MQNARNVAELEALPDARIAEYLAVMGLLRQCLDRLDLLGADLAAVHLAECLNELGKTFISE